MQAAKVPTVASRSPRRCGDRNGARNGPVAPTNMVTKEVTAPTSTKPRSGTGRLPSLGAQVETSTKTATTTCRTERGRFTATLAPMPMPITAPSANHLKIVTRTWRRFSTPRPRFEPSCTTPCTGISAAGGTAPAITATISRPPPRPRAEVISEATKLTATRPPAVQGASPSGRTAVSRVSKRPSLQAGGGVHFRQQRVAGAEIGPHLRDRRVRLEIDDVHHDGGTVDHVLHEDRQSTRLNSSH